MAHIKPFKGIFYKNISQNVIAPPYDVINKEQRKKLIKKSQTNIVNITLPDSYDKAKQLLDNWFEDKVLTFDNSCGYYLYTAEYTFEGKKRILKGFLSALKLEKFGGSIKPHEKTLKGPKIDRFNLITKTNAMFCPIMGLYLSDGSIKDIINNVLKKEKPIINVEFENIKHKIYPIYNKTREISNSLKNKDVIIADGHHRYETALMIQEYFNKQGIKKGGFDYIMTLMIDAKDGGLSLSPIHRLVKTIDDFNSFLNQLKQYFIIEKTTNNKYDFIMYHKGKFYFLTFNGIKNKDLIGKLDVSIFEKYIYKNILNLTQEDITNQKIAGYAHSKQEVVDIVNNKEADVGFILNPMEYDNLIEIANAGLTVPQKSTFFHPKIPSGLVGYHFKSIEECDNV